MYLCLSHHSGHRRKVSKINKFQNTLIKRGNELNRYETMFKPPRPGIYLTK